MTYAVYLKLMFKKIIRLNYTIHDFCSLFKTDVLKIRLKYTIHEFYL